MEFGNNIGVTGYSWLGVIAGGLIGAGNAMSSHGNNETPPVIKEGTANTKEWRRMSSFRPIEASKSLAKSSKANASLLKKSKVEGR